MHLGVEAVQALGPIQGEAGNPVGRLEENVLIAHVELR